MDGDSSDKDPLGEDPLDLDAIFGSVKPQRNFWLVEIWVENREDFKKTVAHAISRTAKIILMFWEEIIISLLFALVVKFAHLAVDRYIENEELKQSLEILKQRFYPIVLSMILAGFVFKIIIFFWKHLRDDWME